MCTYWWPWLRMSDNFHHCGRKKRTKTTKYFHPAAIFFEKKRIIIFCHELLYYTAVAIFFFVNRKRKLKSIKESVMLITNNYNIHIQTSTLIQDFWKCNPILYESTTISNCIFELLNSIWAPLKLKLFFQRYLFDLFEHFVED